MRRCGGDVRVVGSVRRRVIHGLGDLYAWVVCSAGERRKVISLDIIRKTNDRRLTITRQIPIRPTFHPDDLSRPVPVYIAGCQPGHPFRTITTPVCHIRERQATGSGELGRSTMFLVEEDSGDDGRCQGEGYDDYDEPSVR